MYTPFSRGFSFALTGLLVLPQQDNVNCWVEVRHTAVGHWENQASPTEIDLIELNYFDESLTAVLLSHLANDNISSCFNRSYEQK